MPSIVLGACSIEVNKDGTCPHGLEEFMDINL